MRKLNVWLEAESHQWKVLISERCHQITPVSEGPTKSFHYFYIYAIQINFIFICLSDAKLQQPAAGGNVPLTGRNLQQVPARLDPWLFPSELDHFFLVSVQLTNHQSKPGAN